MKTIQLTQGKVAIVDDEDYEYLNQFKWCVRGNNNDYAITSIKVSPVKYRSVNMHHLILNPPKGMMIDHKNGYSLDNRRSNLRICTSQQNCLNKISGRNSSSKYKGVCWYKNMNKWEVRVTVNTKNKFLGYFDTELEGAIIYNIACRKYHREFARPNNLISVTQQER